MNSVYNVYIAHDKEKSTCNWCKLQNESQCALWLPVAKVMVFICIQ